jgi:uncharacterized protein
VTKYLVLLAVIALVVWLASASSRAAARRERERQRADRPPQDMVRCAHCGTFLPESESVGSRGLRFCSREHERLH